MIEVVGALASVHDDGGIVYLGLCGPPDPRVLCVTYETMGRKLGDRVVVTGKILPRDPDLVQLEPCLHRKPGPEENLCAPLAPPNLYQPPVFGEPNGGD